MGRYYYLISGLADISFDGCAQLPDFESLRQEILSQASAADRKLLELPLLENDCRRLAAMLEGGTGMEMIPSGLFPDSQLQELIGCARSGEPAPDGIPAFMYGTVCSFLEPDAAAPDSLPVQERLLSGFYFHAMSCGNAFVRDWFSFNLDLNNIRAAMAARKYGLDIRKAVVGDNETACQLRTSGARDWGLSGQLDFFEDLMRICEGTDLAKRERDIDSMRWNWLETNSFFSYFTVEYLFSYMERLAMAKRWSTMDHEGGERLLRGLLQELKGQISVPDEFKNN